MDALRARVGPSAVQDQARYWRNVDRHFSSIDLTLIDRKPETIVVMISGENRTILEG